MRYHCTPTSMAQVKMSDDNYSNGNPIEFSDTASESVDLCSYFGKTLWWGPIYLIKHISFDPTISSEVYTQQWGVQGCTKKDMHKSYSSVIFHSSKLESKNLINVYVCCCC